MFSSIKRVFEYLLKLAAEKKKLSTYLFFLLISFSFWFLSMLSKQHETSISVPIRYINFPADKLPVDSITDYLNIQVKAPGFSLVFYHLFNFKSSEISISNAYWRRKKDTHVAFWIMNNYRKQVVKSLPNNMELLSIYPDTLQLAFRNRDRKKVPVRLNKSINFKNRYRLARPIQIIPDSIMIFGIQKDLDSVNFVKTNILDVNELSEDIDIRLDLEHNSKYQIKEKKVDVFVEVEEFTEKTLLIPIHEINLPKGYTIKLFPDETEIILSTSIDKYKLIDSDFFYATVDCEQIFSGSKTLNINVSNKSDFIRLHRIQPKQIEYILIKD